MILAGILSGIEVILSLPDIAERLDWPQGLFAAASGLTTMAAFIARLIAQGNVNEADDQEQA